uniref:TIL domain-containing protein n=1 Tax=Anopheles funestus TaxID=62324 RepID=A0A182S1G4_ANOFN
MKHSVAFFLLIVVIVLNQVHGQILGGNDLVNEPCFDLIKIIPSCPANERYTCCKPCPEPACRFTKKPLCPVPCIRGCVCLKGYIRITSGGKCIKVAACQKIDILLA